jgi:anhydro-N-acetylmuramic acid kinase
MSDRALLAHLQALAHNHQPRYVIGCMTGTSIDGIDCALVKLSGPGAQLSAQLVDSVSLPFDDASCKDLGSRLRQLASQTPMTSFQLAQVSNDLTITHAKIISELRGRHNLPISLISAHGQTIVHNPPISMQILNWSLLAKLTNVPVIGDLRQADLAFGGQGAPLMPAADAVLYRQCVPSASRENAAATSSFSTGSCLAVANLGGYCNITLLTANDQGGLTIRGGDVCAVSNLLDVIARKLLMVPFDRDGHIASTHDTDDEALDDLLGVLTTQASGFSKVAKSAVPLADRAFAKSLGTGDELSDWIHRHHRHGTGLAPGVLAATAAEAIAQTIARAIINTSPMVDRLILAGGSARHLPLVGALRANLSCNVMLSDDVGVPVAMREAMGWAVLGALSAQGIPIALPAVTGASRSCIAGIIALAD